MLIMGVDYHPSFQQVAFLDQETGECGERRLNHSAGEAEPAAFRTLATRPLPGGGSRLTPVHWSFLISYHYNKHNEPKH